MEKSKKVLIASAVGLGVITGAVLLKRSGKKITREEIEAKAGKVLKEADKARIRLEKKILKKKPQLNFIE